MKMWGEEARHSFKTFLFALAIFVFAIFLTFVEDFCHRTNRPKWLETAIGLLSIWMMIVDGIVLVSMGIRFVRREILRLISEFRGE